MMRQLKHNGLLVPLVGILVFVSLYLAATHYYPGGSNADRTHKGFDWLNNYWCDLIAWNAKNGERNEARNIALSATVILFSSISLFWFKLPSFFGESRLNRLFIQYTGMAAMSILVFMYTKRHDEVILIGGSLSSIPLAGTFRELYLNRLRKLFVLGMICLAFILLNFFMYLTEWHIRLLPVIQKFTLLLFLVWIFLITMNCILMLRSDNGFHEGKKWSGHA